jgi:hypothetical protein
MTTNRTLYPLEMDQNIRFLGLLDSARTAHAVSSANEINNWWMPEENKTHLLHSIAADAITIKQILWGEIIQLPRNQFFDSPAWFNLGYFLVKSKIPLFSICLYREEPTSYNFIQDCANQFGNISGFALSAWPNLDNRERTIIANNIRKEGNFKKMFRGIRIDSKWKAIFKFQRAVLQNTLEYLEKNYQVFPGIIRTTTGGKTTMWQKIESDFKNRDFTSRLTEELGENLVQEYTSALREISDKAEKDFGEDEKEKNRWLNQRTNLYHQIFEYSNDARELLRVHIDSRYEETISESVTGVGRLASADASDSKIDLETRINYLDALDSVNDPNGLAEKYIIDFDNVESQFSLNKTILELLNDDLFQMRLKQIRRIRNRNDLPVDYLIEEEQDHLEVLTKLLPNAVIKKDLRTYEVVYTVIDFCAKVTIGFKLGSILSNLASAIADETIGRVIDKVTPPLKEKLKKFTLNRKKERLAGIIRDWLTKPTYTVQN